MPEENVDSTTLDIEEIETPEEKPDTPQPEDSSKAEIQALTENQERLTETVQGLVDAIMNAPYNETTDTTGPDPVSTPDAGDGEIDWNALAASDPEAFAKAILKKVGEERKVETERVTSDMVKRADLEAQQLVAGIRSQDPEMFDVLQEHGLLQKTALRLMNGSDAAKYKAMKPDKFFEAVFTTAKTNLTTYAKDLVGFIKKRNQKEVDADSERPSPGGPRKRLVRDYSDLSTRETVKDAMEECRPMFDAARKAAKEESTIL